MPEGLTLEEQKHNELELYITSVIYLFTYAALNTLTGLVVLFLDVMAVLIFRSNGINGAADIVIMVLLFFAVSTILLLAYATVQKFAQGPVYVALCVMIFFNLIGGIMSKVFFSDVPQVMYYVSFLHEICCLANAWATNNHRFAFFNAIEYTWDQFDWMDKIVRPGLEEALIRMYLKAKPLEVSPEDEVVIESTKEAAMLEELRRKAAEYPTHQIKTFQRYDYEHDFQKTVKFYTRQKRELSEWMQSVKFEDIKSNPKENSWMQDKIGKTLGRKLMGEQEYLKYQEGVRKELAMREGWNHKSAADRKKKRKGEPGGLDLGPQTIVKMTDM
ncbi:unnamed protein product [Amoebophrya sp. A120]|nr:unnamed protein product [Amoebophrya sp. A120]|eukprot:GSA120T00001089001.1